MPERNEEKFNISIETAKSYSLPLLINKLPLFSIARLSHFSGKVLSDLHLTFFGACGDEVFLKKTEITIPNLSYLSHNYSGEDFILLDLCSENIFPDRKFLTELKSERTGTLYVSAGYSDMTANAEYRIRLLPKNVLINYLSPELLGAFVTPFDTNISRISENALSLYNNKEFSPIKALYSAIGMEGFVYSLASPNSFYEDHPLLFGDELFAHQQKVASPTELALVFSSCAERMGLYPVIIFLKGTRSLRIFTGAWREKCEINTAVLENKKELYDYILSNKLIVWDCSDFSGGHNTDFDRACKSAASELCDSSSRLIFAFDLYNARRNGILPVSASEGESKGCYSFAKEETGEKNPSDALRDCIGSLFSADKSNPLISFLPNREFSIPLFLNDLNLVPSLYEKPFNLFGCPSEINLKSLSAFGKNLISMYLPVKNLSEITNAEAEDAARAVNEARSFFNEAFENGKIYSALKQNSISSSVFALFELNETFKIQNAYSSLYLAAGFLKFNFDGREYFSPISLFPAEIIFNNDDCFIKITDTEPRLNLTLLEFLQKNFDLSFDPEKAKIKYPPQAFEDCFRLFSHILSLLSNSGSDISSFEILHEAYISYFPAVNSYLAKKLSKSAGRALENKLLSAVLSGKKYVPQKAGKVFDNYTKLPFEATFEQEKAINNAVSGDYAFIGPRGSGKKQAAANVIARNILNLRSSLVISKNSFSLSALKDYFSKIGAEKLCLDLTNAENIREYLIKRINETVDFADNAKLTENEIKWEGNSSGTFKKLEAFSEKINKKYDFGLSLKESYKVYLTSSLCLSKEERKVLLPMENVSFPDIGRDSAGKIFLSAKSICEKARALSFDKPLLEYPLCGIRLTSYSKDISDKSEKLLNEAYNKAEKLLPLCNDVLNIFGIDNADISSFLTANELFELFSLFQSLEKLPIDETLLDCDTYKVSKEISAISPHALRVNELSGRLSEYPEKLLTLSAKKLNYIWQEAEKSHFLFGYLKRKSVIKELRKYMGGKKPSRKAVSTVLNTLCEREDELSRYRENLENANSFLHLIWKDTETDWKMAEKIAVFAKNADTILKKIYKLDSVKKKAVGRNLYKISEPLDNPKVREDLTSAIKTYSELLEILFNKEGKPGDNLTSLLLPDFYSFSFPEGLLSDSSRQGLLKLLYDWRENLTSLPVYCDYNIARNEAISNGLSSFCDYLEQNGVKDSTDNIFLSSISHFSCMQMAQYSGINDESLKNYRENEEQYKEIYVSQIKLNQKEIIDKYIKNTKAYLLENREQIKLCINLFCDNSKPLSEVLSKTQKVISVLFPLIFATADKAVLFDENVIFDKLVILQAQEFSLSQALSLATLGNTILLTGENGFEKTGSKINILAAAEKASLPKSSFGTVFSTFDGRIYDFISHNFYEDKLLLFPNFEKLDIRLVFPPQKSFENTKSPSDISEARCSVLEAYKLYEKDENASVIIAALSIEQEKNVKEALAQACEKSLPVKNAVRSGKLSVVSPFEAFDRRADYCILTLALNKDAFSEDKTSFSYLDDYCDKEGYPDKLLFALSCAKKSLIVVSSFNADEIDLSMTASPSARAIKSLLSFVKNKVFPIKAKKQIKAPSVEALAIYDELLCDGLTAETLDEALILTYKNEKLPVLFDCLKDTPESESLQKVEYERLFAKILSVNCSEFLDKSVYEKIKAALL